MIKKYLTITINKEISPEDFARQSKIQIKTIEKQMKEYGINRLNLENTQMLVDSFDNLQIIDSSSTESIKKSLRKINHKNKKIPVISILGHIDHGKTSLIDAIMKTSKVKTEAGSITQNISLYKITKQNQDFFLIDTPGHEIFSNLRKFIIDNSDIVIILIAGDDGIKDQTREIIKQAHDKEKIICINKIDQKNINFDYIYSQLADLKVVTDVYGGEVLTSKTSAKTGQGIDELIDNIFLKTESLNLKSDIHQNAYGNVIDSSFQKGFGLKTRILLKTGTLQIGDHFVCENQSGIIKRIIINDKSVTEASYNDLIDIIGLEQSPIPGAEIFIIENEKIRQYLLDEAKAQKKQKELLHNSVKFIAKANNINQLQSLETLLSKRGYVVSGSINPEISDSELEQARIFNCLVVFCGDFSSKEELKLEKHKISFIKTNIIYKVNELIEEKLKKEKEITYKKTGMLYVLKVFNIGKNCIAGCQVKEGIIKIGSLCDIIREGNIIGEGKVSSMRREKNNILEAAKGSECGIILNKKFVFLEGDSIIVKEIED